MVNAILSVRLDQWLWIAVVLCGVWALFLDPKRNESISDDSLDDAADPWGNPSDDRR